MTANPHFLLRTKDDLFKFDGQIETQIVAALLARARSRSAAHVEHLAEEVAEDVAEIHGAAKGASAETRAGPAQPCVAIAIISGALVGIAQHLIGLAGLSEPLLGRVVAGVAVGMKFECQLAIGALQLL